jgi:hypothetical protein
MFRERERERQTDCQKRKKEKEIITRKQLAVFLRYSFGFLYPIINHALTVAMFLQVTILGVPSNYVLLSNLLFSMFRLIVGLLFCCMCI